MPRNQKLYDFYECLPSGIHKTWSNAWATSSRMHEDTRLQCIFGCEAPDDLNHYLCCDPLWTAVISNCFNRVELLWTRPLIKIGLVNPKTEWLQMTSVAFSCYHSIRLDHWPEVLAAQPDRGNPCQVLNRLRNYARAFSKDFIL